MPGTEERDAERLEAAPLRFRLLLLGFMGLDHELLWDISEKIVPNVGSEIDDYQDSAKTSTQNEEKQNTEVGSEIQTSGG
jgi:hypothetical protein